MTATVARADTSGDYDNEDSGDEDYRRDRRRSPSERSHRSVRSSVSAATTTATTRTLTSRLDPGQVRRVLDRLKSELDSQRDRAERAETALSTSRAEIDRLRRRRQDDETDDTDAVQQGASLEAAALALTRQLTLTRRRLAADGRFGEQMQRCVDRLTDSLNEFSHRQNDYYNGKLVRLENSLRYLRAENVRLASRHRGPVPESHYQYEQQPDSSINQLEQLKRRNAHLLDSAAERLKSRVRQRPDEDNKLMLSELRRDYEKRRTRDLAENGRQLEEKERELERLRRHYEGLQYMTRSTGNSGEKDAMERMLQTVQRERLTLQHQLSWNQEFFSDASTEDRLKRLTTDIQRVESARRELDEEIRRLRESAVRVKSLKQPAESAAAAEEEEEQAAEARQQKQLRLAFKGAGREADRLQFHMAELELIMKHMKDSLERKFQLDQEGTRVKRLIDRRSRNFLGSKAADKPATRGKDSDLEGLRSQLRDLEKRSELQSLRHEELLLELEATKKRQRRDELRQLSGASATSATAADTSASASASAMTSFSANRLSGLQQDDSESEYQIPWTDSETADEPVVDDGDFFALRQAPVGGSESEGWQPSRQSPADAAPPDGYMFGELVDGKSGYIPSNFVQQFASDSPETARIAANASADSNPLAPGEWRVIVASNFAVQHESILLRSIAGSANSGKDGPPPVPPPRELRVERQMASSVLLSWRQPAHDPASAAAGDTPTSYEVLLDGRVRCRLNSVEKTRTLLESVPANERHRVSVRSVTASNRKSDEAACTVSVGGGPDSRNWLAPTSLQISHLTGKSAVLAFLPAASALPHSVQLNGAETHRCEAGGRCRIRFDGLKPDTLYRAEVRALPSSGRDLAGLSAGGGATPPILTAAVEFRTGLRLGRPEPPANVQVESGPQNETLLVTWTPLAGAESKGTRLGGYAIYADASQLVATCRQVDADHCVVAMATLPKNARAVTCRTVATDQDGRVVESEDSSPACELDDVILPASSSLSQQEQVPLPHDSDSDQQSEDRSETRTPRSRPKPTRISNSNLNQHSNQSSRRASASPSRRYQTSPSILGTSTPRRSQQVQQQQQHVLEQRQKQIPTQQPTAGRAPHRVQRYRAHHRRQQADDASTDEDGAYGQSDALLVDSSANDKDNNQSDQDIDQGKEESFKEDIVEEASTPSRWHRRHRRHRHRHRSSRQQPNRIFVALYDYDPASMSPNPDGVQRELAFLEGQLLTVFGSRDADGFYNGECAGKIGLIPGNMVADVSEYELTQSKMKQSSAGHDAGSDLPGNQQLSKHHDSRKKQQKWKSATTSPLPQQIGRSSRQRQRSSSRHRLMVALHDFEPDQALNCGFGFTAAVAFRSGDLITPLGQTGEDGFLLARVERSRLEGFVPRELLRVLSPDE